MKYLVIVTEDYARVVISVRGADIIVNRYRDVLVSGRWFGAQVKWESGKMAPEDAGAFSAALVLASKLAREIDSWVMPRIVEYTKSRIYDTIGKLLYGSEISRNESRARRSRDCAVGRV